MTARSHDEIERAGMRLHAQLEEYIKTAGAIEAAGELFSVSIAILERAHGSQATLEFLQTVLECYGKHDANVRPNWGFDEDQFGHA
jgi:hypothetical protein